MDRRRCIREAMPSLNEARGRKDLLLKIGIHEGPYWDNGILWGGFGLRF